MGRSQHLHQTLISLKKALTLTLISQSDWSLLQIPHVSFRVWCPCQAVVPAAVQYLEFPNFFSCPSCAHASGCRELGFLVGTEGYQFSQIVQLTLHLYTINMICMDVWITYLHVEVTTEHGSTGLGNTTGIRAIGIGSQGAISGGFLRYLCYYYTWVPLFVILLLLTTSTDDNFILNISLIRGFRNKI